MNKKIEFADFSKVDIRVGKILNVKDFPEAKNPSYILFVDFGSPIGVLKTSAQITVNYDMDDLVGRCVLGVVNLPSKQIGPFLSEFLLLGCPDDGGATVLAGFDAEVVLGAQLH